MAGKPDSSLRNVVVVVIPAFQVERELPGVLASVPEIVDKVLVVNDASRDKTADVVRRAAAADSRVVLIEHTENQGVGGAMITGFRAALTLNADIIVKVDGDGQMAWADLPAIMAPLVSRRADFSKGNRFRDFLALKRMPIVRRAGNTALSFLSKAATGYWNLFDPTNGYVALRSNVVALLELERLDRRYFFEQSLLAELYLVGAVGADVPLAARYGAESSNLSVTKVLWTFPAKLLGRLVRRLWLKNFLFDFNMASVYLLAGVPMLIGGTLFGGYHWVLSNVTGIPTPTGTVVLPALLVILAVQFLIAAIDLDIHSAPTKPLSATERDA